MPVGLAVLLLALLAVLAAMQHHWLGRASEADLQRTSASLQAAAARFAADFNRELGELLAELVPVLLHGPEGAEVVAAVERWRQRATWPDLVRGVWQVDLTEDGAAMRPLGAEEAAADRRVPAELQWLADLLAQRVAERRSDPSKNPFLEHPRVLMAEVPAIVVPRPGAFRHGPHEGRAPGEKGRRHRRWWFSDPADGTPMVWVVHLDDTAVRQQMLPGLAQRHFSAETELRLRVVDANRETVWTSTPVTGVEVEVPVRGTVVAQAELFGPFGPRGEPGFGRPRRGIYAPVQDVLAAAAGVDRGQWLLEVVHPAGSLDEAVAAARHRNLMLSFVILLVLAGSIVLLAQGARRAQALARRQMEFVAGVTHELRTPVAALRSAGQNLAHGVVRPERVNTYGELVDREGRRLEDAIDQILAFAGLSSGSAGGRGQLTEPLEPLAAVRRALEELSPVLEEKAVTVDVSHMDDLPAVLADAESLGRALRNLIQNAALHGRTENAAEGWVGVDIEHRDGRVLFHVRDRGPGVDPADRKRIFEPFVRGSDLAASNVPGSGLGLALVRQVADAHGGSVILGQDDELTTFTLTLPAAST